MKLTKSCKRWMDKNNRKIKILKDEGLNKDVIGIIARYIGSKSNDNRMVCEYCGNIYTVKEDHMYRKYNVKKNCVEKTKKN